MEKPLLATVRRERQKQRQRKMQRAAIAGTMRRKQGRKTVLATARARTGGSERRNTRLGGKVQKRPYPVTY